MQRKKTLKTAYFLWALGGPWGLHHVYLARYRQAFLWITTLGGFLGLGWIRDVSRIPDYVAECNGDQDHLERLIVAMKLHQKPPLSVTRVAGEVLYGTVVGIVVIAGLPQDLVQDQLGSAVTLALLPLCTGLAVYLVANIGAEKAELKWSLLGAYSATLLFCFNPKDPASPICQSAFTSAVLTNWKGKSWRRTKYQKCSIGLFVGLSAGLIVYGCLLFSALYHNAYITTTHGEQVKLRDAIGNIRNSEAWKHPLETLRHLWKMYGAVGLGDLWKEFIEVIDPEGEMNAYQILGVYPGASEKELKSAYMELVKKYHPDRISDPDEKLQCQKKFIDIQKAFDTLSTIRMRRNKAHRVDRSEQNVF